MPPPVDTVRLCVDEKMLSHTNCYRWVRRALRCSPAALEVRNRSYGGSEDRFCKGEIEFSPSAAGSGCRRLRILRLANVTVADGVMEQLGAVFPVLEDLELRDCAYSSSSVRITSSTLRKLTLSNRGKQYSFDTSILVPAVAAAPRLAALRLDVHAGHELDMMPRLEHNRTDETFRQNAAFLKSLCELVGTVATAGASCIELSGFTTAVRPSLSVGHSKLQCTIARHEPIMFFAPFFSFEIQVVEKKDCVVWAERFLSVPLLQAILDEVVD